MKKKTKRKKKSAIAGCLMIIGGREDKAGEQKILREIAERNKNEKLVVMTIASEIPEEVWREYKNIFANLGCTNTAHFNIYQHDEAQRPENLKIFENAQSVFFAGGDQLKITSKIGGTPIYDRILEIYHEGGLIVGTSAGAAIMGNNMLVGGENSESHKVGNWMMAPGLGFLENILIDQHFAQRGRINRLLSAIAMNPGVLGVGIDEDTCIIVEGGSFKVFGSNAVYVVDGKGITTTNMAQAAADKTMSMHNVKLHIMAHDEEFNLKTRKIYY